MEIRVGDKVKLIKRPYITGEVVAVDTLACTVKYDGDLIPPWDAHFYSDLEIVVDNLPSGVYTSKYNCECGIDSTYGKGHGFGHADYCPKGK